MLTSTRRHCTTHLKNGGLPVHSAVVLDPPRLIAEREVTGVVDAAEARQVEELGPRLLLLFEVATRQANASHEEHTALSVGLPLERFRVQDVASVGGQLCADGDHVARVHVGTGADH